MIDDVLYPYAARRQEYRRQYSDEQSLQYFADLQIKWQWLGMDGEHLISANYGRPRYEREIMVNLRC